MDVARIAFEIPLRSSLTLASQPAVAASLTREALPAPLALPTTGAEEILATRGMADQAGPRIV